MIPTTFKVTKLADLVNANKDDEAQQYMNSYFFKSGIFVYFYDVTSNIYTQYSIQDAKKLIPRDIKRFNKRALEFDAQEYLQSTKFMSNEHKITINLQNDLHVYTEDDIRYINMAKPFTLDTTIDIDTEKFQDDMDMLYNHIKIVWADNSDEVYEFIMNFLACSVTGKRKLRKALYLPCSTERAGRGTVLNFINTVIGDRMYKTSSVEEILKYTKNFEGTSLINFDELPTDSNNYKSIGDSMKGLVTEPTFVCRDMFCKGYAQKNTFNIIITSNNNAINLTQSNKERYLVCDVNTSKAGDQKYFTKLNNLLKKKEIKVLFYRDMVERYNTKCAKWNEDITPDTNTKRSKMIESLPLCLKYVKDNYALRNRDMHTTTTEFYDEYYRRTKDRASKQKISASLKLVDIVPKRVRVGEKTHNYFSILGTDLFQAYQNKHWIDNDLEHVEDEVDDEYDDLDAHVALVNYVKPDVHKKSVDRIKQLEDEIKLLSESKDNRLQLVMKTHKEIIKTHNQTVNIVPKSKTSKEIKTLTIGFTTEDMDIFF